MSAEDFEFTRKQMTALEQMRRMIEENQARRKRRAELMRYMPNVSPIMTLIQQAEEDRRVAMSN